MAGKSKGPIRVGIIGQGRSGLGIHANWFVKSPRKYKIAAVTDILKDRRERAEQEFGCETYADYREMLQRKDLDLVVNSLPSHLHPQGTVDALRAGHNQALCLLGWKKPDVFCLMDRANVSGDAEDHVKVILTKKGLPTIDLEISSCCPYPGDMYQVYGTQGGLSGGASGLKWRYFKPKEAPKQELMRLPLPGPSYCRETLKWYEKEWAPTKAQKNGFTYMSKVFYDHLYKVLKDGAPLQMTLEQVAVQVAVMEECHRQCSLSKIRPKGWPKGN